MRINGYQNQQYQRDEFDKILNPENSATGLSIFSLMSKCIEKADTSGDGVLSDEEISVFMSKNTAAILSEIDDELCNFSQNIDSNILTQLMDTVKNLVKQNSSISEDTSALEGMSQEDFINNANESLENEDSSEFWQLVGADGAEKVFNQMDTDGDGSLSAEELAALSGVDGDDENISLSDLSKIFSTDPEATSEPFKIEEETSVEKPQETSETQESQDVTATEKPQGSTSSDSQSSSGDYNYDNSSNNNEPKENERTAEVIDAEIKEQEDKKTTTKETAAQAIAEQQKLIDTAVQESNLSDDFKKQYNLENERIQGFIDEKDTDIEKQKTIVSDSTAQANAYSNAVSEISSQISSMQSEKSQLNATEDTDKISDYESKIQNLETKKAELEEAEREENRKIEAANREIEKLEKDKSGLETKKDNVLDLLAETDETAKAEVEKIKADIQTYQANIKEIESTRDKDIASIDENIQKLKTEKANLVQKADTTKTINENRVVPDNSPVAITGDVASFDWASIGYDAEAGKKLADGTYAYANGRAGSHNCLGGVKRGFINATGSSPFGAPEQGITSACKCLDTMRNNESFREVTNIPSSDYLKYLPAGAVVVWDSTGTSSAAGQNGHISVSLGNGDEASDHVCHQYRSVGSRRDTYHVFIPIA